jgi:hypothetical protein
MFYLKDGPLLIEGSRLNIHLPAAAYRLAKVRHSFQEIPTFGIIKTLISETKMDHAVPGYPVFRRP